MVFIKSILLEHAAYCFWKITLVWIGHCFCSWNCCRLFSEHWRIFESVKDPGVFPYFLFGFLLDREHIKNLAKSKFSLPLGLTIISVTLVIFGVAFPKDAVPWLLGSQSYAGMGEEHFWDGIIRAGQYALCLIVTFGFLTLVPKAECKLTVIGQRTLYVYLLHGFIIKTIEAIVPDDTLNGYSQNYLLLLIFLGIICLLLGNYFTKKYTRPFIELKL